MKLTRKKALDYLSDYESIFLGVSRKLSETECYKTACDVVFNKDKYSEYNLTPRIITEIHSCYAEFNTGSRLYWNQTGTIYTYNFYTCDSNNCCIIATEYDKKYNEYTRLIYLIPNCKYIIHTEPKE